MSKADWYALVVALWTSGVLTGVAHAVINLIKANTKNKNVLLLTNWVEQGVNFAESKTDLVGEDKKKAAISLVSQRLFANNLDKVFSAEQIDAEVEKAVADLHNWHPEVKTENSEVK